ncbi:PorT family protein [Aquimarina sp. U1-2]|uniref:porin family protein n=1 Tax=Aquimarina sp. U1-2 TaxID=2823141 RepID=UPI001AECCDC2|nr:porin family protein [Aquimarina sp. U1-2]MBP2832717.1 PorT family protein [Aquimarina sp. U1-2]
MKKLVIIAIAIVGITCTSSAQGVHLGFKGGLNFADVTGDIDADGRTGYHLGAVVDLNLSDKFGISPEVIYSAQGTDDLDVDYLNVPILAKIKLTEYFDIHAGPQFGFVVNDDFEIGDPESFDFSGAVGVGAQFSSFFAQLRYNIGVTDIVDDVDTRNAVFQVSVGYRIF